METQYVKNGKKVEAKATRKSSIKDEYAKARKDINTLSFKAADNNPNNPVNWISSKTSLDQEITKRKKALSKHFETSSKDDLLHELAMAFIAIDIKNMALGMATASNARNALANKEFVERSIDGGIKRNTPGSIALKGKLEKIRQSLKNQSRPLKRSTFFIEVKKIFPYSSNPTIQSWWGKLKEEFI
jgi:hypothetical protein